MPFFFLPFTCFSKLLSLWLITEEEEIFLFECFDDGSTGAELGWFNAEAACFSAGNMDKGDRGALVGAAGGNSGRSKNFFTPGALSTVKFKEERLYRDLKRKKKNQKHITKVCTWKRISF